MTQIWQNKNDWDTWRADCEQWRGRVLAGEFGHWCAEYDGLPVDETCPEWPCDCHLGHAMRARKRKAVHP